MHTHRIMRETNCDLHFKNTITYFFFLMNTFSAIIFSYYLVKLHLQLKFPQLWKSFIFFEVFGYYNKMSDNDLNYTYGLLKLVESSVLRRPQLFNFLENLYTLCNIRVFFAKYLCSFCFNLVEACFPYFPSIVHLSFVLSLL